MEINREFDFSWDFASSNTKEYTHCYHAYPAMMIPQVARRILKEFLPKKSSLVFDPYVGSGTTLVESRILKLNSIGTDLNPLARIISKTKSNYFDLSSLIKDTQAIIEYLSFYNEKFDINIPSFKNIDYWFSKEKIIELSYLKRGIDNFISESNNSFFVLPFSETIREVSYTRNSEFKLFRIEEKALPKHNPNTFEIFIKKIKRNLEGLKDFIPLIDKKNFASVYDFNTCIGIPDKVFPDEVDMILTSPPYGDSRTTVAYGQFSRLSSQWLGINEAEKVDKMLMGGKISYSDKRVSELSSVRNSLEQIKNLDEKRYFEVVSFIEDYIDSINNVSKVVRKNGIVVYVVGNRTVKNNQIDLDLLTKELFTRNGFSHRNTIIRNIPNKKMPKLNSPTNKTGIRQQTMNNEYIVILKKE